MVTDRTGEGHRDGTSGGPYEATPIKDLKLFTVMTWEKRKTRTWRFTIRVSLKNIPARDETGSKKDKVGVL